MEDKLTFDNLHELLDKFASMNHDRNKNYADAIRRSIDNGMYKRVQRAISIYFIFILKALSDSVWH